MKKLFFFAIVIACIVTINGLLRSIYDLWKKQDVVVSAQKNLEKEKIENARLKLQLSHVNSMEFVESEARDKLFMVKPGESGVIIPDNLKAKPTPMPTPVSPNWQKWLNLISK